MISKEGSPGITKVLIILRGIRKVGQNLPAYFNNLHRAGPQNLGTWNWKFEIQNNFTHAFQGKTHYPYPFNQENVCFFQFVTYLFLLILKRSQLD